MYKALLYTTATVSGISFAMVITYTYLLYIGINLPRF